jgi:hypothetical protein
VSIVNEPGAGLPVATRVRLEVHRQLLAGAGPLRPFGRIEHSCCTLKTNENSNPTLLSRSAHRDRPHQSPRATRSDPMRGIMYMRKALGWERLSVFASDDHNRPRV